EEITKNLPDLLKRIKAMEESFKDVDPKKVLEQVETLQAGYEKIRQAIATRGGRGSLLPGVEDERKNFSLIRACMAVKRGGTKEAFEKVKAGLEYEIMSQYWDAANKAAGDGTGQ